ncbi:hypothetical protein [Rhizobium sp.]|uniref:hypothetical protein n=1 Tax=Rhizobium sp. TaxID=391 RepID=UPI002EE6A813
MGSSDEGHAPDRRLNVSMYHHESRLRQTVTKTNRLPCFGPAFDITLLIRPVISVSSEQEVDMTYKELTIADVLNDPLIRQVMRADHVSLTGMTNLLQDAAHRLKSAKTLRGKAEIGLPSGMNPIVATVACNEAWRPYQSCGR